MKKTFLTPFCCCFYAHYHSLDFSQSSSDPIMAGDSIAVTATESGKVKGYMHEGIFYF